jgi:HD-GYP domain-containing protein (c-di-GMP phosphodiesterase class II)
LFIQSIVRDITERKQTEARIQLQLERLNALREIDKMITGSLDLKATLTILLKQAETQLGISAADILLINPSSENMEIFAELGFDAEAPPRGAVDHCEPLAGRAAGEGHLVSILDLSAPMQDCPRIGSLTSQGFKAGFAVPLIAKGQVKGVLEVFHRQAFQPSIEWVDFLETLGGQAAIAVDSHELFQSLQRSNMDLVQAYDATLEGWAKALELRDEETEGHSHRVVDMTVRLGRENGYREENLVHLRRGALLHDIGKLSIPDSILLKPGALTVEEWQIMKLHPVYAKQMLSDILFLNLASDIPYFHHEKWDGSGYPHGLQGDEIPLAARIFAIVDVWDALTSDRPYRRAWTKEKALDYIRLQKGKHFDPKVVEQFLDLVEKPLMF